MSRPDDVSQEAWDAGIAAQDAAIKRCIEERLTYPFPTCNGKAVLDECVARAITAAVAAEREACAELASAFDERTDILKILGKGVAAAIRARSAS